MSHRLEESTINALIERETGRFMQARPRSAELLDRAAKSMPGGVPMAWMRGLMHHAPVFVQDGSGASFTDVDGHSYVDFNQADMSSTIGHAIPTVIQAVTEQVTKGFQFLLPVEDAITVSEELAARFGRSHWQYTLSASSANTEAIRLARLATGREKVLMFDGSYHGHIGETMLAEGHDSAGSHALGLPRDHGRNTHVVSFNDLDATEAILAHGETACVIAEPALTNVGLVVPQTGFFERLRTLCDRYASLLIIDETHTHMLAFGGLVRHWDLKPHIVVLGKNVAGGLPIGMYGFDANLAEVAERNLFDHAGDSPGFASGGTLYGNALSMHAARACLEQVLTVEAYQHISELGTQLAQGINALVQRWDLPWKAQHVTSRVGWLYALEEPMNGASSVSAMNVPLSDSRRIFFANRGIWEAIVTAGPAISFPMTAADVDLYLAVSEEWLETLLS